MTVLDDARRLAERVPVTPFCECVFCDNWVGACEAHPGDHEPDCPWLALPRIVAAMEAAARLIDAFDASPPPITLTPGDIAFNEAIEDLADALGAEPDAVQ